MKALSVPILIGAMATAITSWAADSVSPRGTSVKQNAGVDLLKAWPSIRTLSVREPKTFEVWINPSPETVARKQSAVLILSDEGGADAASVAVWLREGKALLICCGGYFDRAPALQSDRWAHLAVTLTPGKAVLWINGKAAGEIVPPQQRPERFDIAVLAKDPWSNRYFDGMIGDFRVSQGARYTQEFSPAERLEKDAATLLLLEGGTQVTGSAAPEPKASPPPGAPVKCLVQYIGKDRYAELTPLPGPFPSNARDFRDLPLLLKEPAVVSMGNKAYAVEQEGLYRFFDLGGRDMRQASLYRGNLWLLAGNLSLMRVHGWRDQSALSAPEKEERVRKGRLSITCGPTATFVAYQFNKIGVRSRIVDTLTLDEWNDYDCGHTLMEIFDPAEKRWILYDSDIGCRLRRQGRPLDLGEACRLYREGQTPELDFPAGRAAIDPHADQTLPEVGAFYSMLFDATFRSDAALHTWYRRVLQVPVIGGVFPSDVEAETARARSYAGGAYCRERLSWNEWRARFYGK